MGKVKDQLTEKTTYLVLLLIVVAGFFIWTGQEKEAPTHTTQEVLGSPKAGSTEIETMEKQLEDKIAVHLESIQGVGKAKVLVTFYSVAIKEYARDQSVTKKTSNETDKEGGTRQTEETTESNQLVIIGNENPVLIQEKRPEIAGVLVIAQGAADPKIKEQIFDAVRTLLNVPASKINVAPMGGK